jgi:glutamate:Na+ symporter, ESS family
MSLAILILAVLLLIGFALRAGVPLVRSLHVPASVVGGVIGLIVIQSIVHTRETLPPWLVDVIAQFRAWPATLIAIVFAGLLIERPAKEGNTVAAPRDVARQAIAAWIVVLGQVALGVALVWLWIRPAYGVPGTFGQLIEVGMAGGPGTARAMGDVYARQFDFPAGTDLGLFVATFGLVWGLISGIALARLGIRRGWTANAVDESRANFSSGVDIADTGELIGRARVRADLLDPLTLQILWLTLAFAAGWALQLAWTTLLSGFDDAANKQQLTDQLASLPLFVFTTFGGLIVRELLHVVGLSRLLDPPTVRRLTGVALDVVIVTSITVISPASIAAYGWPIAAMLALGCAWCVFNLLWVSPRLLPRKNWFELGLMNYGFATATTPQSLLLLKLADRDLKSGAAETYAGAVPLSAPFIGGGLLTFVGFPLVIAQWGEGTLVALCVVTIVGLWFVGRRMK